MNISVDSLLLFQLTVCTKERCKI